MTRQILGTLTFAALMSALLIKLFAQLALADVPRPNPVVSASRSAITPIADVSYPGE